MRESQEKSKCRALTFPFNEWEHFKMKPISAYMIIDLSVKIILNFDSLTEKDIEFHRNILKYMFKTSDMSYTTILSSQIKTRSKLAEFFIDEIIRFSREMNLDHLFNDLSVYRVFRLYRDVTFTQFLRIQENILNGMDWKTFIN